MNGEAKALWIEALRSEKYRQGFRYLNEGGCMCVMGVLCDVYAKFHKLARPWMEFVVIKPPVTKFGFMSPDCIRMPSHEVIDWAGLTTRRGDLNQDGNILITMNDSGIDFRVLADHIERNFKTKA